jgi:ribulose-5-phosphate 4-epimerase/fuculose-1-phosphate aldolase
MEEGYIKYHCNWIQEEVIQAGQIHEINTWRSLLMKQGYIGMYDNGIGFGNISTRIDEHTFMISGSATGGIKELTADHYALVTDFNLTHNQLTCKGMTTASSESLTHASIYACSKETNAVVHIHHKEKWSSLLNHAATTDPSIAYGTPEMAFAIQRLINEDKVGPSRIIVMVGHEEGLIAYGKTLEEAAMAFLKI